VATHFGFGFHAHHNTSNFFDKICTRDWFFGKYHSKCSGEDENWNVMQVGVVTYFNCHDHQTETETLEADFFACFNSKRGSSGEEKCYVMQIENYSMNFTYFLFISFSYDIYWLVKSKYMKCYMI